MLKGISNLQNALIIPVPPSKIITDCNYDARLLEILEQVKKDIPQLNYVNAIKQIYSTEATHSNPQRPSISKLKENYEVDATILKGYSQFIIFDDMLTTGAHFKAIQEIILNINDKARIAGLFLARRVIT